MRSALFGMISLFIAFAMVFTPFGDWPVIRLAGVGFSYMGVFFHELGHCVFSWLFGYPSLPYFDFQHGGGMNYAQARLWPLQIIVWLTLGYLTWHSRSAGRIWCVLSATFTSLMISLSLADFHNAIILFMGHGAEVLIGAFLLMRGFWGILLTRPAERSLNVVIGAFMLFSMVRFARELGHADYRWTYLRQKGQHGMGDFSRIADYGQYWTTEGVGLFLMGFTVFCTVVCLVLPRFLIRDDFDDSTMEEAILARLDK